MIGCFIMKAIDLFCGAGGLSSGFVDAGFEIVFANEIRPVFAETYKTNHPGVDVCSRDIREVDAVSVRKRLQLRKGELDVIAGGPPCQGFSINAPKRSLEDRRNHLFLEFLRFVDEFEPKVVVIENVPGLVSFDKGSVVKAIVASLDALGYMASVRIMYAPDFGVPQARWRTIIIAYRTSMYTNGEVFPRASFKAPRRINFTSSLDGQSLVDQDFTGVPHGFVSIAEAISDLPRLGNGESGDEIKSYSLPPQNKYQEHLRRFSSGVHNHEAPRLAKINMERFKHIPQGGNWTNIPPSLLPEGMKRAHRSDHTKRYGRGKPDGLASTILTKCDPHWGEYIHYEQDRTYTVREAARLQSFPDRFIFTGNRAEQYEQVGNAVPPMLAKAIAGQVRINLMFNSLADKRVA